MKASNVVFFLLLMVVNNLYAQEEATNASVFPEDDILADSITVKNDSESNFCDHLTIISDPRINKLLEIQKEESIRKGGIAGYRVQIYQGNKKDYVDQLEARFLSKFPEYEVHVRFDSPDFRVRIGDFRSRSEAIKLEHLIEKDFPNSFIVEDNINFPDLIENKPVKEGKK